MAAAGRGAIGHVMVHVDGVGAELSAEAAEDELLVVEAYAGEACARVKLQVPAAESGHPERQKH